MNMGKFNDNPPKNTVSTWLLPCTCQNRRCHCNARFKLDIPCVHGIPYQHNPPEHPIPNLII